MTIEDREERGTGGTDDEAEQREPSEPSSPLPSSQRNIEKKEEEIEKPERRGRKPLSKHPEHILTFKQLRKQYPEVVKAILSLCSIGDSQGRPSVILRGRWGYFSTNRFRKAMFQQGESVLSRVKDSLSELEGVALDNLHEEGMVFASYDSLIEFLDADGQSRGRRQDHVLPEPKLKEE